MKLRTTLLLGIAALVIAIVAATAWAVARTIDRSARADLSADLARSRQVFLDLLDYRHASLRSDCRVVANEPRLRAVVATQDISRETVLGVVGELRTSLGSDLFLLTDGVGTLIADVSDPDAAGYDMSGNAAIAAALASGEGTGVWIAAERPHQVQACRVDFGAQPVGVIVVGRVFDDVAAQAVYRQTGSTLVVAVEGNPVAVSTLAGDRAAGTGELDHVAAAIGEGPRETDVAGSRYLGVGGPFPGYDGKRAPTYTLARSLDEALAPGRGLIRSVLAIAAGALVFALALAFALSQRLSRPVARLVEFTRRIGQGDLAVRAEPQGPTEVRALAGAMNQMVGELDVSRRALAEKERLEREMEIAMKIQTSILPKRFEVAGLEIAARMIPATEVGGDYYDILPDERGCWIGVGDVAGHGLTAGLEMLMVQSVIAALVRENPAAAPKDHLAVLNHVIFENIRNRLDQDEHITLTLLRYADGVVTFAGAHEEIVLLRAAKDRCERVATPGTWLGAMRDIAHVTRDTALPLAIGDLMVLYSDGVTEAPGAGGEQFGMDRLCKLVEDARGESAETVRDRVVAAVQAWQTKQDDDISVVVVRRAGARA